MEERRKLQVLVLMLDRERCFATERKHLALAESRTASYRYWFGVEVGVSNAIDLVRKVFGSSYIEELLRKVGDA